MKFYPINPFFAAVMMSVLCMGMLGLFVVVPVACIQLTWNFFAGPLAHVPQISVLQACLLYLAFGTALYLLGFIQIDIEAKELE